MNHGRRIVEFSSWSRSSFRLFPSRTMSLFKYFKAVPAPSTPKTARIHCSPDRQVGASVQTDVQQDMEGKERQGDETHSPTVPAHEQVDDEIEVHRRKKPKLDQPTGKKDTTQRTTPCPPPIDSTSLLPLPPTLLHLKRGELMHSTNLASASKRSWLAHAPIDWTVRENRTYCSSDGSSTGWHSCVIVPANATHARLRARWKDHEGTRNVGAEAMGFLLAVETLSVLPALARDVVFLVDFLNALAFDAGAAKFKTPLLVEVYAQVEAHKRTLGFVGRPTTKTQGFFDKPAAVASEDDTPPVLHRWDRVHHPGHQKNQDTCWFTRLNICADVLASLQQDVDVTVPLSALADIARCEGKNKKVRLQTHKDIVARYAASPDTLCVSEV